MFSTEMYSKRSKSIIENHDKTKPLFLMVSFQSPHNPYNTPPSQFTSQYSSSMDLQERQRAATITALDTAVGDIMESLKAEGLYDNSVVLFSSDNGGPRNKYNSPLKGRKEQVINPLIVPLVLSQGRLFEVILLKVHLKSCTSL